MKEFRRVWHIDVLHHSHTDIGYTARQEKICRDHAGYLRQTLDILRREDAGDESLRGFRWQCENFWQIENFLKYADERERADLERYAREGRIGLSGSYLNLTDLIDERVLNEHLARARAWADTAGASMKSAMTADINGYSAGLPDMLAAVGVGNLYTAIHTHHGMYPMGHNPSFFRWRGPKGNTVLTFVGEHYHWGHVLGLCPHATSSFMLNDDILYGIEHGQLLSTDAESTERQELDLACERIGRYLDGLEESGWPLDFVPVVVSGIMSDNSPPNGRVAERIAKLNERFGGRVILEMTTLDPFFAKLEAAGVTIPEYEGDFTDWWADGVGSTPAAVKMYREAQRSRNLALLLDPEMKDIDRKLWEDSGRDMMLYAEHTWGHSASVSDPYKPLVSAMHMKKTAYAVTANNAANELLDGVLEKRGNRTIYPDRTHRYRVINPYPETVCMPVSVPLLGWEYLDGCQQDDRPLVLRDPGTGELLPTQTGPGPRGRLAETVLTLEPGGETELALEYAPLNQNMTPHTPCMCADAMTDQASIEGLATTEYIETPFFIVKTDRSRGVASITDRETGRELIDPDSPYGAFTCVYEVTPTTGAGRNAFRRHMGRSRCTVNTRRYAAKPENFAVRDNGDVSVTLNIAYTLEGTDACTLDLKIGKLQPRIDARIRIKKKSVADPEGILTALPFVTDGSNETWIDKTGCVIRPGIDQLPGTCKEFWCLQNGIVRKGKDRDLLIASPDVPLVCFGPRKTGPVTLCDAPDTALNRSVMFSWIMNNFWETNFCIDLGGYYEFSWSVELRGSADAENGLKYIEKMNTGLPVLEL
ncbi:MAG: hypothetical protein Q4G19_03795 [Clostridia bacterium]|nr:hypothetical protein [Clostridia bacterium]